ncbi:MAG: metal ABC transporter substrate-binding protein [Endomicrobia bacterium]|nr:metal ABC transporter substrate-binding protein [Endomicrobiia bacterium]MCL2799188.1 metal ABC transporter substrate-binding protein [Endomicrobiia bacterium]
MKKIALCILFFIFYLLPVVFAAPFSDPNKTKIIITATNSNIGELVKIIGGDKVDVEIIVPPISCSVSYDPSPSVIERVMKSNLVLSNKWEKWVRKLKIEAGDRGKIYKVMQTEGNWMIPYIHARAAEEVKNMLSYMDAENAKYYDQNYARHAYNVNFMSERIIKELDGVYGKKVICNDKIRDVLESFGFDVVAVYGRSEELTAKKLAYLIDVGKKKDVKIVIDNLQSGTSTGRELALNLGANHAVISNFILGKSYINTFRDNVERIKQAAL